MNKLKSVFSNYFLITLSIIYFSTIYFFYKILNNGPNNQIIYNYNLLIPINILITFVIGIILLKANNYIKNILVVLSIVLIISSYSFEFYLYLNHYSAVEHNLQKNCKNIGYKYDARPFQKIRILNSNEEEIFYVTAVKMNITKKTTFLLSLWFF